jgi:hypothetical protein
MNVLINGDFEGGWYNAGVSTQVPNGWMFDAADSGTTNPISPDPWNQFLEPEVRVLPASQLPDDERDIFILDGDHALKIFKGHGAWLARFAQVLTLESGTYRFSVNLWPDLIQGYDGDRKIWAADPDGNDGLMRFVLNGVPQEYWESVPPPTGQQSVDHWRSFDFEFQADGETELGIELMCPFALNNSGFFADGWTLERIATPTPPDCRGTPREQYRRTVLVLPRHATLEQATQVFTDAWPQGRTITGSYDDAGIGDLDERNAILYGIPELEKENFRAFYKRYYPGVVVTFEPLPGEPEPPEPPTEPPRPYTYITWHKQSTYSGILNHVKHLADAGKPPRFFKIVNTEMEMAPEIKAVSPDTAVVFRHVDDNIDKYKAIAASSGFEAAVMELLNQFLDGVRNVGFEYFDVIESLNEIIGTHQREGVAFAVNYDIAFLRVLADLTQGEVRGGVLTAAVGNPDHDEVVWLLPAAHAAAQYNGVVMPHTYFYSTPAPDLPEQWLTQYARDASMRPLLSWDPVFKADGLELEYAFGEYGAIGVNVNPDGTPGSYSGAGVGWRTSGSLNNNLPRYVNLMRMDLAQLEGWNRVNNWRAWGHAIFTTGGGEHWAAFEFNDSEWSYMIDRLLE